MLCASHTDDACLRESPSPDVCVCLCVCALGVTFWLLCTFIVVVILQKAGLKLPAFVVEAHKGRREKEREREQEGEFERKERGTRTQGGSYSGPTGFQIEGIDG